MAKGRRDYTWGFLNEAAQEGRFMAHFGALFNGDVAPGPGVQLYDYTMPAGYRRSISRIQIINGTDLGNAIYIKVAGQAKFFAYFDSELIASLSETETVYWSAGEELTITVINQAAETIAFYGYIMGTVESMT